MYSRSMQANYLEKRGRKLLLSERPANDIMWFGVIRQLG